MKIIGIDAIEFAKRTGIRLYKEPEGDEVKAMTLTLAQAGLIAVEKPELIWADVSEADYCSEA